ncbi:UPF0280 family protein [Neptunicoccus cionae]|uniref:Uncharacterized protein n=1 Tax=Neptunicoccus cionae TaxID=2035344 RepID=A0A916QUP2_9RHOB|nr:UPF0280 family protein [Amylibacter cionae]GGA12867.1 hypothetical protein GCM10011498_10980 [Amylibacter cionae]
MIAAWITGDRLHLQHGPIDLIIGAEGDREAAFEAAKTRFSTVLDELVSELPLLRSPMPVAPQGRIARRMARAATGHADFVTPMAAVAGAVADEVLSAMLGQARITRAYVNNGGDIALHLGKGQRFEVGIAGLDASALGKVTLQSGDGIGGIATSGQGGRSLSLGIAQSVTVLADCAATADAAATLIANRVDLPDHPAITREKAEALDPDSDLGARLVVTGCGDISAADVTGALENGAKLARAMQTQGRIKAAYLLLQGQSRMIGTEELADA